MVQTYRLSPGAMLYAVLRLHKSGIYGLLDVFSDIPDAQFPACIQNAEEELMEKGYGIMDFDGNFSMDENFAGMIGRCADENCVFVADRRKAGKQERMTCYLKAGVILTQEGPDCILHAGADIPAAVLGFLKLTAEHDGLEETCVDSMLVTQRDMKGLTASGCGSKLAELIVSAAGGDGGYAQLVRITDKIQTELLALAWGEAGTVTVGVEYTQQQEIFRLTPITDRQAGERIAAMTAI